MAIQEISVEEAKELLRKNAGNAKFVVIDVRTAEEYEEKHLPNAVHLDFYSPTFEEELAKLDREKTYLLHCQTGSRSRHATYLMEEMGFPQVYNVKGILLL